MIYETLQELVKIISCVTHKNKLLFLFINK